MSSQKELPGEITTLLRLWGEGDREALRTLAEATYPDLRSIAAGYVRRETPGKTLQATGLVNELYLRLAKQKKATLSDRRHFFVFAAMMMRRILLDQARDGSAQRRAGIHVPLHPEMAWVDAAGEDMIALDTALKELESLDDRKARVVELRYFLGYSSEETAELLDVGRATVDRDIQFALSWLHRRLHAADDA